MAKIFMFCPVKLWAWIFRLSGRFIDLVMISDYAINMHFSADLHIFFLVFLELDYVTGKSE